MQNQFQETGYLFIEKLIHPDMLFNYAKKLSQHELGHLDVQVPGARVFYKEPMFEKLLDGIKPIIEDNSGYKLFKTYSFVRVYELGDVLRPHKDREACEVTVTVALGHEGAPWPIYILDKDRETRSFILKPGDAVMFKGIELLHWREENTFGPCIQAFLHYVNQDGVYASFKNDENATKLTTTTDHIQS